MCLHGGERRTDVKIVQGEDGLRSKEGLLRLGEWSWKAVLRDVVQNKYPVIVAI